MRFVWHAQPKRPFPRMQCLASKWDGGSRSSEPKLLGLAPECDSSSTLRLQFAGSSIVLCVLLSLCSKGLEHECMILFRGKQRLLQRKKRRSRLVLKAFQRLLAKQRLASK